MSKYLDFNKNKKQLKWTLIIFVIHNVLYISDYSIKGDYPDYIIFSLEYLFFCVLIFLLLKQKIKLLKGIGITGTIVIIIGFIQGIIGIFLFIVVSQDFESDKIYNFNSNEKSYQTRRYSFGFATLDDIKYTFETYRTYKYLPFEIKINKTDLFGFKSDVDITDEKFNAEIEENNNKRILRFSSTNEKQYKIKIE